jgi:predicted nucleotidyltransferase
MLPFAINNTGFGLTQTDLDTIVAVISRQAEVEEAIIFGSRAKGNYTAGSDVDIALKGAAVSHATASYISYKLNEETQMPYHFDVLNYQLISNPDLTNHIDRVGVSFYKQG